MIDYGQIGRYEKMDSQQMKIYLDGILNGFNESKKDFENATFEIEKLRKIVESVQLENEKLKLENQEIVKKYDGRIEILNVQFDTLKAEKLKYINQYNDLVDRYNVLVKKIDTLTLENESLKQSNVDMQKEVLELKNEVLEVKENIILCKTKIDGVSDEKIRSNGNKRKLDDEQIMSIIAYSKSGKTLRYIGEKFGISKTTVDNYIKAFSGLEPKEIKTSHSFTSR